MGFINAGTTTAGVIIVGAFAGAVLISSIGEGVNDAVTNKPEDDETKTQQILSDTLDHTIDNTAKLGSKLADKALDAVGGNNTAEENAKIAIDKAASAADTLSRFFGSAVEEISKRNGYATPVQPNNAPTYDGETDAHKECMRANNNSGAFCFGR